MSGIEPNGEPEMEAFVNAVRGDRVRAANERLDEIEALLRFIGAASRSEDAAHTVNVNDLVMTVQCSSCRTSFTLHVDGWDADHEAWIGYFPDHRDEERDGPCFGSSRRTP